MKKAYRKFAAVAILASALAVAVVTAAPASAGVMQPACHVGTICYPW
ncbi:hypothetical protein [Catenulispora rubra]|nr:hypothetical protein [Catenulispora rubra]